MGKRIITLILLLWASAAWGMLPGFTSTPAAGGSYVFEEDFADNSAGWDLSNNAVIGSGYLQLTGSYPYASISTNGMLTTGVEYTITFDVTAVTNPAWLRVEHPATIQLGAYITASGTVSRTFTASATQNLRFIIDDNTSDRQFRIDNVRICEGSTCE